MQSAVDRKFTVLKKLRRTVLPLSCFLHLIDAGCCSVCVGRLCGISAGLS
jgi:hypothetical protein